MDPLRVTLLRRRLAPRTLTTATEAARLVKPSTECTRLACPQSDGGCVGHQMLANGLRAAAPRPLSTTRLPPRARVRGYDCDCAEADSARIGAYSCRDQAAWGKCVTLNLTHLCSGWCNNCGRQVEGFPTGERGPASPAACTEPSAPPPAEVAPPTAPPDAPVVYMWTVWAVVLAAFLCCCCARAYGRPRRAHVAGEHYTARLATTEARSSTSDPCVQLERL